MAERGRGVAAALGACILTPSSTYQTHRRRSDWGLGEGGIHFFLVS
jgi:hypothetical protein